MHSIVFKVNDVRIDAKLHILESLTCVTTHKDTNWHVVMDVESC